mgnify:CR=1 FL=1
MRIDTALTDQLEVWEAFQKWCADFRPFADQDQCFRILQPIGKRFRFLKMIIPYRDIISVELLEAIERSQCVEVIVEYRDLQENLPCDL